MEEYKRGSRWNSGDWGGLPCHMWPGVLVGMSTMGEGCFCGILVSIIANYLPLGCIKHHHIFSCCLCCRMLIMQYTVPAPIPWSQFKIISRLEVKYGILTFRTFSRILRVIVFLKYFHFLDFCNLEFRSQVPPISTDTGNLKAQANHILLPAAAQRHSLFFLPWASVVPNWEWDILQLDIFQHDNCGGYIWNLRL